MLEQQVMSFINNKMNVDMHSFDNSACNTIKSGNKSRKPESYNIIVQLIDRKTQILKTAKLIKGTNFFINECLTKKSNELVYMSRNKK